MLFTRPDCKKSFWIGNISISILVCLTQTSYSQIKPNTQTQPGAGTQSVNPLPSDYGSGTINMIRVWDAQKPFTSDTSLNSGIRTTKEVKQTTQYFDGLGRPLQTVAKAASPNGYDMVSPVVYDPLGREVFKYLPYVSTSNNGQLQTDAFTQQSNFMSGFYNPTNNAGGEKYFYSKTDYEPSPLNRPVKTYAPGNNWVGDAAGVGVQYLMNDALDSKNNFFMTTRKNQHVTPKNGAWQVIGAGNEKATKVAGTQKAAIEIAKQIAKNQKSEVVIHGEDGKIRDKDSYGFDPTPPKDKKH
jgi:hypothetical protein